MTPLIQQQLKELQTPFPGAQVAAGPGGLIVTIPGMKLEPPGAWNKATTTARFVAAPAYPQAKPDCFWVDADVRLASGGMPQNSQHNTQIGENLLWFSWHIAKWNPQNDDLLTYVRVIQERLRQPV